MRSDPPADFFADDQRAHGKRRQKLPFFVVVSMYFRCGFDVVSMGFRWGNDVVSMHFVSALLMRFRRTVEQMCDALSMHLA
jgi:hypothetical protein